jgi:uncharacterized membrane protein
MDKEGGKSREFDVNAVTAWVGSVASLVLHTFVFVLSFVIAYLGIAEWSFVLLILTTAVSLEAIYLAIFIQMSVNRQTMELLEVSEDVEDIQEDIEEMSEDVEGLEKDVGEMQEDVEDIQEDIQDLSEEEKLEVKRKGNHQMTIEQLTADVRRVLENLETFKKQ